MKKIILAGIVGTMLLSNVVIASAATLKNGSMQNNATIVSVTDSTIFHPQSQDPDGW